MKIASEHLVNGELDVPVGTIVDARFRIIGLLGSGGMCTVYEAEHIQLQRRCALKVMRVGNLSGGDAFARFQREAILSSEIKHPNIIEISGFGIWNSRPFIAMEYVEGRTLSEIIDKEGPMSEERALPILLQICNALRAAHAGRVVHRDLKPSNVMIGAGDQVKLVDFGIARLLPESGEEMQKLTQTGQVLGTFVYMSPEQCMGRTVDGRADLYAFGGLMYKLFTGKPPFEGETPFELMSKHLGEHPLPMTGVSARMRDIALWCLKKDPAERPQNAEELRDALLGDDVKVTQVLLLDDVKGKFALSKRAMIVLGTVGSIILLSGAFFVLPRLHPAPAVTTDAPSVDEQLLLEALSRAEASKDQRQIGNAQLKLCEYYDGVGNWKKAERAGHAALGAYEKTPGDSFQDELKAKYFTAVAQQNDGNVSSAIVPFYRISVRLLDAPPELRQLSAFHAAQCCIVLSKLHRADSHFRHALKFGDAAGFSNLQQIRMEYAQFLLQEPNWGQNEYDARHPAHGEENNPELLDDATHSDPAASPGQQREVARDLLRLIIKDGAKTREDQHRVNQAKMLLQTIPT